MIDDRGRPVEEFSVDATFRSTGHVTTLASASEDESKDGVVSFPLPTQPFSLDVEAPGYQAPTTGPHDPEATPRRITVTATRLEPVRGVVLGPDGPRAGVAVSLHRLYNDQQSVTVNGFQTVVNVRPTTNATTGPDGVFELYAEGRGDFVIRAEEEGFALAEIGPMLLDGAVGGRRARDPTRSRGCDRGAGVDVVRRRPDRRHHRAEPRRRSADHPHASVRTAPTGSTPWRPVRGRWSRTRRSCCPTAGRRASGAADRTRSRGAAP